GCGGPGALIGFATGGGGGEATGPGLTVVVVVLVLVLPLLIVVNVVCVGTYTRFPFCKPLGAPLRPLGLVVALLLLRETAATRSTSRITPPARLSEGWSSIQDMTPVSAIA